MGFSPETYAVARKYTDDTVAGAGAVAGKPCQIQSITDITGGHRVTFLWVDNSSVSHTSTMDVMDGEKGDDGLGIKSVAVNSSNHLIVTYDDDTTEDAGEVTLDTSDFVQKSSTAGLLKNDGTVDTNTYVTAVSGKGLSTNDYDNTAKTKLDDLANIKSVGTGLSLNSGTGELTATGGGGSWGSITGTLSDQTDLQTALDGKQATLTFDNVPTNGSNNPVKSDGIYDAINDVYDVMGENGAVNRCPNYGTSQTVNGVVFIVNSENGKVVATTPSTFTTRGNIGWMIHLPEGTYRGTGAPENGFEINYQVQSPSVTNYIDTGSGVDIIIPSGGSDVKVWLNVELVAGVDKTATFEPMITLPSYTGDYVPYAMTNRELTNNFTVKEYSFTSSYPVQSVSKIYKYGRMVNFTLRIKTENSSINANAQLATIPDDVKPLLTLVEFSGNDDNLASTDFHSVIFTVNNAGVVTCRSALSANRVVTASISYISKI